MVAGLFKGMTLSATTGPSRPTKNPAQDVANFFATSGWTVQAGVNANDPAQSDPASAGPQATWSTRFSGTFSTDPYQAVEAPEQAEKPAAKKATKKTRRGA